MTELECRSIREQYFAILIKRSADLSRKHLSIPVILLWYQLGVIQQLRGQNFTIYL